MRAISIQDIILNGPTPTRTSVHFEERICHGGYGGIFIDTKMGAPLRKWLEENISTPYMVRDKFVLFDDRDDALLCYLRYGG